MSTPEPYGVSLSLRARRETRRLDRQILARIAKAIDSLVANPRPPGCLKKKQRELVAHTRRRLANWLRNRRRSSYGYYHNSRSST